MLNSPLAFIPHLALEDFLKNVTNTKTDAGYFHKEFLAKKNRVSSAKAKGKGQNKTEGTTHREEEANA